jgi:threonine dehydrogenase-like Zn-dependent dehydrogenase
MMKAVAVMSPGGAIEIVDVPLPEPGLYDAIVKSEIAYICNATDRKLAEGHFPGIGVGEYPLLLGHENAGVVTTVGKNVRTFKPGDKVIGGLLLHTGDSRYSSGWGGNSEYVVVTDHEAMVADGVADPTHGWDEIYQIMRKVPDDIPIEAAGLLCTWREVYGAFNDFRLKPGDNILIYGAGPVGLSFCLFAKLLGLGWVGVVDPLPEKRRRAETAGANRVFEQDDPALRSLSEILGFRLDAVVDAVGQESIVNHAIPLVKMGGSVCVYGVVASPTLTIEKHLGPYNFNLLLHQWPTRTEEAAAHNPLIQWIREGKLDYRLFKTGEYGIENINEAFAETLRPTAIKTMLRFEG